MRKITLFLFTLAVITLVFSVGCTSKSGPTQASPIQVTPTQAPQSQVTTSPAYNDFSQVTHVTVSTVKAHWSSGAEDDGITVHPDLQDAAGQTLKWSGVSLPVDIEIYTLKFDANYKQVKDKLVYKGTGTINSWQDGNMFLNGGIQIPFADMNVPGGETYGVTYVTVHTPDGKTYSDKWEYTSLTP